MRRKLQAKHIEEKKNKRNQRWLGIALIFIMFGSVFGVVVAFFSSQDSIQNEQEIYMGYDLTSQGGFYVLTTGVKNIYLATNPNDLELVDYDINLSKIVVMYSDNPLYIDSSDSYSRQTLEQNLFGYPNRISEACVDELDCANENAPIKTCEDNIIITRVATENKIYEDNNCVYIEAAAQDIDAMTDAFLLKVFGIN